MVVGSRRGKGELRVRPCSAGPDALCLCPYVQVLEYNVIGGKYQRGLLVLVTLRELVEPKKQDAASVHRALIVGWCVELVRAEPMGWGEEVHQSGVPFMGPG